MGPQILIVINGNRNYGERNSKVLVYNTEEIGVGIYANKCDNVEKGNLIHTKNCLFLEPY